MQKVYNVLGVLGFVMSGTMAVMGVVAYTRVPSMVKSYVSNIKLELTEAILNSVPVPEVPKPASSNWSSNSIYSMKIERFEVRCLLRLAKGRVEAIGTLFLAGLTAWS